MLKKITTKDFIRRAKNLHGDKYNYEKSVYTKMNEKILIVCRKHGEYWQIASNHIRGRGCQRCSNDILKIGDKRFIEEAKKIHGNKYDYSKVEYKNNRTKVCITCKKHGEFWQIPDAHLRLKCGCQECSKHKKITTEEFIKRSNKIHNGVYDYNKVKYKNNNVKVIITCKEHGDFLQSPQHHMNGSKCPKCCDNQQMTRDEFVEKATKVHREKYDYSKLVYKQIKRYGNIICKKHGEFKQKLDNHLQGKGCPHCVNKNEGQVKNLLLKHFKDWKIIPNKKIWDKYKDYNHKRYCDFWLEKDNIKIVVEYDGRQHYKPICFNGISFKRAEKEFETTQVKDKLDKEFCEENNIILYRIKYDEDKEISIKNLLKKVS